MRNLTILLLICSSFLAAGGSLLLRIGAKGHESLLEFINWSVITGLCLYVVGVLVWIYALSKESLVNVYSFAALTFVLVYAGSNFLLGEKISLVQGVGIALILLGLFLITFRQPL